MRKNKYELDKKPRLEEHSAQTGFSCENCRRAGLFELLFQTPQRTPPRGDAMGDLTRFSINGQFDDGTPLMANCHDKPISIKFGDSDAETYWAKAESVACDGVVTYKLLPMDRA